MTTLKLVKTVEEAEVVFVRGKSLDGKLVPDQAATGTFETTVAEIAR